MNTETEEKQKIYEEATMRGLAGNSNGTRMEIVFDAMQIYAERYHARKCEETDKRLLKSQVSEGVFVFPSHAQISKEALNVYGHKEGDEQELNIEKHRAFIRGGIYVLDECCKIYDKTIASIKPQIEVRDKQIGILIADKKSATEIATNLAGDVDLLKSQLKKAENVASPSDEEVGKWFDENIGYGKENPCSASSAIYKFRLWLKERGSISGMEEAIAFSKWKSLDNELRTIEHYFQEVAKKHGYDSWADLHNMNDSSIVKIMEYEMEAMQLYGADQLKQQVDPEEAFVAGYKKRAEQSGLLYDFASELHARSYYIKFKSQKLNKK